MQFLKTSFDWQGLLDQEVFEKYPKLRIVMNTIGNTEVIKIPSQVNSNVTILAKAEFQNPWGTVKDRSAFGLIFDALKQNRLQGKQSILEYSGGSLGVALANLCHFLEVPLTLVLFDSLNDQQRQFYKDKNVSLILVKPSEGFLAVIRKAHELDKTGKYCFLNQHENYINPWLHSISTGNELVSVLKTLPEIKNLYFGASVGTGGTFNGIASALKYNGFSPQLFLTCPAELPYGSTEPPNGQPKFAGSGGLGFGIKQRFVEVIEDYIGLHFNITFEEANNTALKFFQDYDIPIGSSAGANYFAAEKIASSIDAGTIVTVFPSLMPRS
jgi:cysteine synthase A